MRRLALDVIRTSYGPAGLVRVDAVHGAMWQTLIQFASEQSVLPAIADCIIDAGGASDPSPIFGLLRYFKETAAQENEQRAIVLANVVSLLASAGVESMPLKGAAFLAAPRSGRSYVRSMVDIDLLLRPHQIAEAVSVLKTAGYYSLAPDDWYQASDHHHVAPLSDPAGTTPIELHVRLDAPRKKKPISTDILFRDATLRSFAGRDILLPGHEHRLVHLIIHALFSNNGYRLLCFTLRDVMDLIELDRAQAIDWDKVREHFEDMGYQKQAAGFLMAAEHLLAPAFQAPQWAEQGHAWAKQAVEAYFHPERYSGRRMLGQLLCDIGNMVEKAEHRKRAFRMLVRFEDLKKSAQRYVRLR
jgi:hypothetical protein